MKNTLFYILILLIVCGSCSKSSVKDYSLTPEEYQQLGMPGYDSIWTFDEYSASYMTLSKLKEKKPFALPIKDSKRSKMFFNRMISLENLSFLQDEYFPLNEKAHRVKGFLLVQDNLIDVYTNIRMRKQYYNRELVYINIFGLNVAEKMLELADQINESEDHSDVMMKSGYESIQMIYLSSLKNVLEKQTQSSRYFNNDLEVLSDSIFNSVFRNSAWMDSTIKNDLKQALYVAMDSTSSDYIKEKFSMLTETL